MATGRCVCGLVGPIRKVRSHVLHCPAYVELYRRDPANCPDPETLHTRHQQQRNPSTERTVARDARLTERFIELDRIYQISQQRWRGRADILED